MHSDHRYRILFVAHSAQQGGAEYCLDTTLRYLDRNRFEPIVVFPHEGPMVEAARSIGIDVEILPLSHWMCVSRAPWYWKHLIMGTLPSIMRLRRLIRRLRINIVYSNTSAIFEGALCARWAGVPHLWHVHEVLSSATGLSPVLPVAWIRRFIRKFSSLVVFESHSARAAFESRTPLPAAKVVPNSIRLADANETNRDEARRQLGVGPDAIVVAFVGQLIDRKNPLLLVDAIKRIRNDRVVGIFVGDGPLASALDKEIQSSALDDRIRRIPFQSNVGPLLDALDILVLPSREESFGLVLIEAAACGKPVVACRSQGPNEVVVSDETGILVDQDDPIGLSNAIARLASSERLRAQLGQAARRRAFEVFDPQKNTVQLEQLMDQLISGKGKAHGCAR